MLVHRKFHFKVWLQWPNLHSRPTLPLPAKSSTSSYLVDVSQLQMINSTLVHPLSIYSLQMASIQWHWGLRTWGPNDRYEDLRGQRQGMLGMVLIMVHSNNTSCQNRIQTLGQLIWARLTTRDWCRPIIFHHPFIVYVSVLEDQMLHP